MPRALSAKPMLVIPFSAHSLKQRPTYATVQCCIAEEKETRSRLFFRQLCIVDHVRPELTLLLGGSRAEIAIIIHGTGLKLQSHLVDWGVGLDSTVVA